MTDVVIGIDLGTSNSVISVSLEGEHIVIPDAQGNLIHPSLVYFFPDGRVVIGNDAKPYLIKDPEHTVYSAKRLIGRQFDSPEIRMILGSYPFPIVSSGDGAPRINMYGAMHSPEGISGRILSYLKSLAENYLGQPIEKAVITVPANFDEGQRRATKRAGELAGLDVLRLINEPTAAALAYGYGADRREKVAIYDFGGGTFDVTLLELRGDVFQVLATAGNSFLGGDDFDNRLVESMLTAFEKQHGFDMSNDTVIEHRLKAIAQDIKHRLSSESLITSRVSEMVPGSLNEVELEFSLTQDAFAQRTFDLVKNSISTCEEALELAGLQRAEIDHLVLVGGTTKIPYVQREVESFFNRKAVVNINPDEVVSIGAAIFGQTLSAPAEVPMGGISTTASEHFADDSWLVELEGETPPPIPGGFGTMIGLPGIPGAAPDGPTIPKMPSLPTIPGHAIQPIDPVQSAPPSPPPKPVRTQAPSRSRSAGPVLIDVTPHALGIATIGGVMDIIIERNGSIPLKRTRRFSTSRDNQERVVLPIFSGNSRRIEDNHQLGVLELIDIAAGPREDTQIEVTFEVDTSGMLHIYAIDMRTGKKQSAQISILGQSEDLNYYDASDLLLS